MHIIRHGDVLLVESTIPKDSKEVFTGTSFVAQEGEKTGHKHMIKGLDFKVYLNGSNRYFSFPESVTITHEEHKTLTIPATTYIQIQEVEIDWFTQTTRQVID